MPRLRRGLLIHPDDPRSRKKRPNERRSVWQHLRHANRNSRQFQRISARAGFLFHRVARTQHMALVVKMAIPRTLKRVRASLPPRTAISGKIKLALGELEAAARFRPAVFLAFDDARIARNEPAALENRAQVGLVPQQRFR